MKKIQDMSSEEKGSLLNDVAKKVVDLIISELKLENNNDGFKVNKTEILFINNILVGLVANHIIRMQECFEKPILQVFSSCVNEIEKQLTGNGLL